MTNTIIFLAVLASFIGFFIWKETDSRKKNRRVWRIVEDTPLSEQNVKDLLTKLGATSFSEDKDDGGLYFIYQDELFWIHFKKTPAVFLANRYSIDEEFDLDICEQTIPIFNSQFSCGNVQINRETRKISFMTWAIAPSYHILKEAFPYMVEALNDGADYYKEVYYALIYRNSIKTK